MHLRVHRTVCGAFHWQPGLHGNTLALPLIHPHTHAHIHIYTHSHSCLYLYSYQSTRIFSLKHTFCSIYMFTKAYVLFASASVPPHVLILTLKTHDRFHTYPNTYPHALAPTCALILPPVPSDLARFVVRPFHCRHYHRHLHHRGRGTRLARSHPRRLHWVSRVRVRV